MIRRFNLSKLAKAAVPAALVFALASTPAPAATVTLDGTAVSTVTQYDLSAKVNTPATTTAPTQTDKQAIKQARKVAKQAAKKAKKCAKWKKKMHRSVKARGRYNSMCLVYTSASPSGPDVEDEDEGSEQSSNGLENSGNTPQGGTSGEGGSSEGGGTPPSGAIQPLGEIFTDAIPTDRVPEPGTLALLGLGLIGLGMTRRKAK